tara:strand:+ start:334 stop:708 length:375 start_codon:yes stop_codon:yes gene_type:complete
MKSNIEKVYSKLPKTELAKVELEKIELANIQMLDRIISDGGKIYNRGVKFVQNRETLTKEAKRLNSDATSLLSGAQKLIQEFEKNAKDLGIKPDSIKQFQKAIDVIGVMDTIDAQTKGYTKIRS